MTLKMIRPTSTAPYVLRFIGDEFTVGQPGTGAVNFRYELSTDSLHATVQQYDGQRWVPIAHLATEFKASAATTSPDALEARAADLIDHYLPA